VHIVQIYHSKVPVLLYGGMERVIESLSKGLLELGHKVTLICYRGDYVIPGVHSIFMDDLYKDNFEALDRFHELIPEDADVLHFHVPLSLKNIRLPYVMTMHGNLRPDEDPKSLPCNTIFLSHNHARRHGFERFVFNGLDPAAIPVGSEHLINRKHFAFLGRASLKRKGLHLAKKIARRFKTPLLVGGGRGISFGNTKYLGHVDDKQKFRLLCEAKALLFPILWDEPFGLVMIEAMFCGTPVFALEQGSVAEVLGQPGAAHLFAKAATLELLIEKISAFSYSVSPQELRDYAMRYFTHTKMAESYIKEYTRVL